MKDRAYRAALKIMQVIRRIGQENAAPPCEHLVHAHFDIEGSRHLLLGDQVSSENAVVYLGHRILENPSDLRSHVQRILLLTEGTDESALQGALIDLFIALGERGDALKMRMLAHATPKLSRTALLFFERNLDIGFKSWEISVARVRESLLALGYSGQHEVVRRLPSDPHEHAPV